MKTIPKFNHHGARSRVAFVFLAASLSLAPRLYPAVSAAPATDETKTHTLFMGADFAIERNKELFHVTNVTGDSFIIKVKGQDVRVPINGGPVNLRVDHALKLTEKSAAISNLKGERAFTSKNDPSRKLHEGFYEAEMAVSDYEAQQHSFGQRLLNFQGQQYRADSATGFGAGQYRAELADAIADAQGKLNKVSASPGSRLQVEDSKLDAEEQFDAIDVSFEVSAEKPLNNPYVVVIARYHEAESKPGAARNWIYARSLQPIAREGTKVHFKQGGFPAGFEIEDFQVHLYNQNEEIATSVSPKRVELTREEAFQYVVIEYVGAHKGATLPAVPAMGKLPADLPGRLAGGEFGQPYYVKVSDSGQPGETYLDESCTQKVENPYLESVVKSIRFKPALAKGRPVAGVARLKFNELNM